MGYVLKRVPLDFQWPIGRTWMGYINPHAGKSIKCDACDGKGWSPEYKVLHDRWWGYSDFFPEMRGSKPLTSKTPAVREFAMRNVRHNPSFYRAFGNAETDEEAIEAEGKRLATIWNQAWFHHMNQLDVDALLAHDDLWDFTRVPITAEHKLIVKRRLESGRCNSWLPFNNGSRPTAKQVNEWVIRAPMASPNEWPVLRAEAQRLGIPTTCSKCKGECSFWPSKEIEIAYDKWRPEEPPTGEAYQIWENVSEGSPVSPAFIHPPALAAWMAVERSSDGTHDDWMRFILGDGWAPDAIFANGQFLTGAKTTRLQPEPDEEEDEDPKLSLVVEAAVLGMAHTRISRKRLRHFVRQRRKQEELREAKRLAEREAEEQEEAA